MHRTRVAFRERRPACGFAGRGRRGRYGRERAGRQGARPRGSVSVRRTASAAARPWRLWISDQVKQRTGNVSRNALYGTPRPTCLTDEMFHPSLVSKEDVDNMSTQPRRYWAIRTDKENIPLLLSEVRAGRLRQGWGYNPGQDLRLVRAEISQGGKWWERLTEQQKEVLGHLKMLCTSEGGVQCGDWILLPNLPEYGPFFLVAEVTGDYYFDMLSLVGDADVNDLRQDYGHVLPVRLVTEHGINRYAEIVDAGIRNTLKTPMRMWNVDAYRDAIELLITQYNTGGEFSTATSGTTRLQSAWEIALSHAAKLLQERLGSELDIRFQAAEWEEPITLVLKNLTPGLLFDGSSPDHGNTAQMSSCS